MVRLLIKPFPQILHKFMHKIFPLEVPFRDFERSLPLLQKPLPLLHVEGA